MTKRLKNYIANKEWKTQVESNNFIHDQFIYESRFNKPHTHLQDEIWHTERKNNTALFIIGVFVIVAMVIIWGSNVWGLAHYQEITMMQ